MISFIGQFQELGDGPSAPSMRDSVHALDRHAQEEVAQYLEAGIALSAVPGFERDVLDGTLVQVPRSHLTDGVHIWRRDLVHYVRKYGVALPDDFIEFMHTNNVPPLSIDDDLRTDLVRWLQAYDAC